MSAWLRALCAALALATTAAQALPRAAEDACCEEERDARDGEAPCPDCPPGLACGCCAVRGVAPVSCEELRPVASAGVDLTSGDSALAGRTATCDIFHPPRR